MALSLGIRTGDTLTVGTSSVTVVSVGPGQRAVLRVGAVQKLVTDQERVEILPSVFVSMGMGRSPNGAPTHRLAFEAPRSIIIRRA